MNIPKFSQNSLTHRLIPAMSIALLISACSGSSEEDTPTATGGNKTSFAACLTNKATYVAANIGNGNDFTKRAIAGGALYDKWWAAIDASAPEPAAISADNPIWDTRLTNNNTSSGPDTWRCKECHGWDYKGVDGAYGTGSHNTGFPGLMLASGKTAIEVFCSITSGTETTPAHQFNADVTNGVFTDSAALNLTAFITDRSDYLNKTVLTGLVDTDKYINPSDNSIIGGDATAGQSIYGPTGAGCGSSTCHLADGTKNADDNPSIGDVAVENPYEVMHFVRFGHAGSVPVMPAFVASPYIMTITDIKNVIAYTATLATGGGGTPTPTPVTDAVTMALGGKLFDHWPDETGVTPPGDNPLWAKQTTNTRTGLDTWRCKECHGWDYKGAAGVYGPTSSHYTGFIGLYEATQITSLDKAYFVDRITNGFYDSALAKTVHDYGQYLGADNVDALVLFIMNGGIIDTTPYISSGGNARGNATNGETLYTFINLKTPTASCSLCHGTDGRFENFGTDIAPEYLGDLALENPWEVLHKARFGQPGLTSPMPGMVESDYTVQDAVDVVTYTQKLNALYP